MTKKFTKALLIAVCALTLVAATFAGTLAYLTAETTPITNTFTAGNVSITLTETNGAASYKLVPAKTYIKDPKVTVSAGSENCYLFVKVENAISAYEVDVDDGVTIAEQMATNGWNQLKVNGTDVANVYYYYDEDNDIAYATEGEYPVFGSFTLNGGVDADGLDTIKNMRITITAYAVQFEGFADAATAWKATFGA